jgi:iron complex outermembrane recepter protein
MKSTMANHNKSLLAVVASLLCSNLALAQALPMVSVSGRSADAPVLVGGFGNTPIAKLPLQADVLGSERLLDAGINALSGITSLDASISDAYNSQGYVSYLKIRGFDLDNRFNYRRDGLPINAETALALGNKSAIEVLKGTSGIQAGVSSPGGLVNLVVKRPTVNLTTLSLAYSEAGTLEAAVDWSQRFGPADAFGLRINAAGARLDPLLQDAKGSRSLLAAAGDWKLSPDTLIEAEFELNRQSQPSQPGFSLLGNKLPDARSIDPTINLNNQPWSQPVVFDNQHASLRVQQRLNADWQAQIHLGLQRLKTDDRLAYPYGCSAADGSYYADRYCPNGNFDMWDFRSENERRNSEALDLSLNGNFSTGGLRHQLNAGLLLTRFNSRFQRQAYNWAGTGNISGKLLTIADPSLTADNTERSEHSSEFYLRDSIQIDAQWQAWAGLRNSHLRRASITTSGQEAIGYGQQFTTPWLGVSYALSSQHMLYASWGQGVESQVTPNRLDLYKNAGQALPALISEQFELGIKAGSKLLDWSINWFEVKQPQWRAIDGAITADGQAKHRGIEAQTDLKWSGGGLLASAMLLQARLQNSRDPTLNGMKPVNVPETILKATVRQNIYAVQGLQLQAGLAYEGKRAVLPNDSSISLPGWTRLDAGARLEQAWGKQLLVWRVGVDNLADRRAWKESPYQYSHAYLYPLAPRTFRVSLEVAL